MDFNIEQNGFTQFVYVLPFSNNKALIEVTRFGAEIINKKEAEDLLQEYIERHLQLYALCLRMFNQWYLV